MEVYSNNLKNTTIQCSGSKSYANRILFLSCLQKGHQRIFNLPKADDVEFFISALEKLNFPIKRMSDHISIGEVEPRNLNKEKVYLGEGGTTIRFMLVLLASLGGTYELEVEKRFLERPIDDFIEMMDSLGVLIHISENTIKLNGKIDPSIIVEVDCEKTTQFATAFLMLKKLDLISDVELYNLKNSLLYIDLTKSIQLKDKYHVPVDWSSMSYLILWGILKEKILIQNVTKLDSYQADSVFIKYLNELGANIQFTDNGLSITPKELKGHLEIDAAISLDLIPSLIVLYLSSSVTMRILNIENLKYKESNRLDEIIKTLKIFNCDFNLNGNSLELMQAKAFEIESMSINCAHDHRIVMMNYLLLKLNKGGEIAPIAAINKSFPEFLEIFN